MSNTNVRQTRPASTLDMALPSSKDQLDTVHPIDCEQITSHVSTLALKPKDEPFIFTACFLSFNQTTTYSPLCHLTLTGAIEKTCCSPTSQAKIDVLWPNRLLQAPSIVVNIYVQESKPTAWRHPSDFFAVHHFLASLAEFLGWSETEVKIKFLGDEEEVGKLLHRDVLGALYDFGGGVGVEPEGLLRDI